VTSKTELRARLVDIMAWLTAETSYRTHDKVVREKMLSHLSLIREDLGNPSTSQCAYWVERSRDIKERRRKWRS
jgi:hypothetical protein